MALVNTIWCLILSLGRGDLGTAAQKDARHCESEFSEGEGSFSKQSENNQSVKENKLQLKPVFLPLGLETNLKIIVFNNIAQYHLSLFLCFLTDCVLWFCGFMALQDASVGLQRLCLVEVNALSSDLLVASFVRLLHTLKGKWSTLGLQSHINSPALL